MTPKHQDHCKAEQGFVCSCVKEDERAVSAEKLKELKKKPDHMSQVGEKVCDGSREEFIKNLFIEIEKMTGEPEDRVVQACSEEYIVKRIDLLLENYIEKQKVEEMLAGFYRILNDEIVLGQSIYHKEYAKIIKRVVKLENPLNKK